MCISVLIFDYVVDDTDFKKLRRRLTWYALGHEATQMLEEVMPVHHLPELVAEYAAYSHCDLLTAYRYEELCREHEAHCDCK